VINRTNISFERFTNKSQESADGAVAYLPRRLVSLDAFRGITIALMLIIGNQGGESYSVFQHAEWNGCTLTDLVFPFFLFAVGAAIPYSLGNRISRGDKKRRILLRIVYRSVILFALGLFLTGFPSFDLPTLRIMGVLQRISLCYFFASVIFLALDVKKQIFTAVGLLLLYWALMTLVPVPGYEAGVLEKQGNLAAYIDTMILRPEHMWVISGTWDPEGLLSTMPALATTLIGVVAASYLRSNTPSKERVVNLLLFGFLGVAVGLIWNFWFPINKNLWTSSYVAFTGGIALILLAAAYHLVDLKEHRTWTKPFVILGANAILVYVLSELMHYVEYSNIAISGVQVQLKPFIYENYFASWAGSLNGSLLYSSAYLMFWLAIMAILFKRRIFIKI